jgi:hypothetical protein
MPYLIANDLPRDSAGKRFRALLHRPEKCGQTNGQAVREDQYARTDRGCRSIEEHWL